jgi:two-component system, OmpR family, phosphate regulon sensor histidine kinase PhoR
MGLCCSSYRQPPSRRLFCFRYFCSMPRSKQPRPLLLFYILVVYVFVQFGWWAYLLTHLNGQITELLQEKQQLLSSPDSPEMKEVISQLDHQLVMKRLMILGEGLVFLSLLIIGIVRTRRSFKKEAALAARQKNFLLSVTHELKSPLASVKLQLETLRRRQLSTEQQHEMLTDAIEDTERLHALVDNILVAARIDHSSYAIHPEPGNVSEMLSDLLSRISAGALRHHQLERNIESGIHTTFDRLAIHSVLTNLLENAANYSPRNTAISVGLIREGKRGIITIADRGPGIPDTEKEAIFRRFYRLGNEETRSTKGTGLGLYIVHYLTHAHGWDISIHDHANGGTIFKLSFPLIS